MSSFEFLRLLFEFLFFVQLTLFFMRSTIFNIPPNTINHLNQSTEVQIRPVQKHFSRVPFAVEGLKTSMSVFLMTKQKSLIDIEHLYSFR